MDYKVGDKIEGLLSDYYDGLTAGLACLIVDEMAQQGQVAFIKQGILVAVISIQDAMIDRPSEDEYDLLVMHPQDCPQHAIDKAVQKGKERFN